MHKLSAYLLCYIATLLTTASAFSAGFDFAKPLQKFFNGSGSSVNLDLSRGNKREELKANLLRVCRSKDSSNKREQIEEIIQELSDLTPIVETAKSSTLQKNWLLQWTTEKEINFFIDFGLSGKITQNIAGPLLQNKIPFQNGGSLEVAGDLTVADGNGGKRTNFVFTKAKLDLGRFGSFEVPPVGEGWFDTIYLDADLRVDINSRDDILICIPF